MTMTSPQGAGLGGWMPKRSLELAIEDVRLALDLFAPVYEQSMAAMAS